MSCENCSGCSSGGGCGGCGILLLSPIEYDILLKFAEVPFYPAAFGEMGGVPVCPDFTPLGDQAGEAIRALEMKRVITVDERIPLKNCDYAFAPAKALCGSVALTAYGQQIIDELYLNGLE